MSDNDWTQWPTFSQAQGIDPLPQPLALGKISKAFRVDLWNWFHAAGIVGYPYDNTLRNIWTRLYRHPIDSYNPSTLSGVMRDGILEQWKYNQVFDVLQFILRQPDFPIPSKLQAKSLFHSNMLAYDILHIKPAGWTIVPNATPDEGIAIREAFARLADSPFDGARTHLRQAAESINAGNAAKSIVESIHAIESVVRLIGGNKDFDRALNVLDTKAKMHPAFKMAVTKLYGYTSDEQGVRHSLLEKDAPNVGLAEAIFMFGASASFITYLIAKARDTGLIAA